MRRWPSLLPPIDPPPQHGLLRTPPSPYLGDIIEPFLACGGATFFIVATELTPFDPRPAGVQLVAFMYVPQGWVGFVKEIRIAPFIPPVFADPWETAGVNPPGNTSWRNFSAVLDPEPRAAGTHGVWTTPFGWESYFDITVVDAFPPEWRWHLRMVRGDITNRSALNLPPFSIADATSWFLVPNVAVPASAYLGGIPGNQPGKTWGPQRMQVLQGDKLSTHVLIPGDHTICLFAEWRQQTFRPSATEPAGEGESSIIYGDATFPLLPSFGQLHGYLQAADREPSLENALFGWGG
jgi:hypothetical protein